MSLFSAARGEGTVGVDESGKGDYFGPLVVAACYVGPEHLAELEGVRDSKTVTDAVALKLSAKITKTCPHHVVSIGPAKYNELYGKFKNLNKMLAWAHARAIENVLEKQGARRIVSDEFAKGGGVVKSALGPLAKEIEFVSRVRAESDPAVAAASILARAQFLRKLKDLSEEFGVELPKGATVVVPVGKRFVAKHGGEALGNVAKLHFKTTLKVLD